MRRSVVLSLFMGFAPPAVLAQQSATAKGRT